MFLFIRLLYEVVMFLRCFVCLFFESYNYNFIFMVDVGKYRGLDKVESICYNEMLKCIGNVFFIDLGLKDIEN